MKAFGLFGEDASAFSPFFALSVSLFSLLASSCTRTPSTPESPLVTRGRAIYAANCTACHNSNPARPGALGPEILGSSLELLEARVLHAAYPPGYTPKRQTKQMVALPQLSSELQALHAYLNSQ